MKVKICGIRDIDSLQHACDLDVDFVGFIMADESPRKISKNFFRSLRTFNFKNTIPVFVFVNPSIDAVIEITKNIPTSILQFHGDEKNNFCEQFKQPFWKVIRIEDIKSLKQIKEFPSADRILLETYSNVSYGGTGKSFDWSILDKISLEKKFILAGGINLHNLKLAISLNPWCIDLNSGVESSLAFKDKTLMGKALQIVKNE
ncbi:MAG: hypothetical protein CMD68_03770 [Gammaproteobacteria bacterium]|nr:hypothetical protein [Gammaproteobacteria bacterium]